MQILDREIRRAIIVDDEPAARDAYAYPIEELNLEPVKIEGPLDDPTAFIKKTLRSSEDVIVCDYHLKRHDYAKNNGDALMAACYNAGVPGILCSSFTDADATIRRDYLKSIPVRLEISDLNPDRIRIALEECILEMNGIIAPARKAWRTLVRVEENDSESRVVYVVIPAWNVHKKIRIAHDSFPQQMLAEMSHHGRFHARVNIGAQSHDDLFVDFGELR